MTVPPSAVPVLPKFDGTFLAVLKYDGTGPGTAKFDGTFWRVLKYDGSATEKYRIKYEITPDSTCRAAIKHAGTTPVMFLHTYLLYRTDE